MGNDILCRSTVGLSNPHTGIPVRRGDFVLVDPDDPKFGPLIGSYLVPVDKKGVDLPDSSEDAAVAPDLETNDEPADAPNDDPEPAVGLEDASERPPEPPRDVATSREGESLTLSE